MQSNTPTKNKRYDYNDSTFNSFMEIITSAIKVSFFCIVICVVKELLNFITDIILKNNLAYYEAIKFLVIPSILILFLAIWALIIFKKKN